MAGASERRRGPGPPWRGRIAPRRQGLGYAGTSSARRSVVAGRDLVHVTVRVGDALELLVRLVDAGGGAGVRFLETGRRLLELTVGRVDARLRLLEGVVHLVVRVVGLRL